MNFLIAKTRSGISYEQSLSNPLWILKRKLESHNPDGIKNDFKRYGTTWEKQGIDYLVKDMTKEITELLISRIIGVNIGVNK